MSVSHTPGPWTFERHPPDSRYFGNVSRNWTEDGHNYTTTITCQLNWQSEEVNLANARLIAAAPQLVEALKVYASMDMMGFDKVSTSVARAALAAAGVA